MIPVTENPIQTGLKHNGDSLDIVTKTSRYLASGQAYLVAQAMSPRTHSLLVLPSFDLIFRVYKSGS